MPILPPTEITISIDSNTDFDSLSNIYGNGSFDTPYILENQLIYVADSGTGVQIENFHKYLIIRNCTFLSQTDGGEGISIYNSSKITVMNCNISLHFHGGITLAYSSNNTISGNSILSYHSGLYIYSSDNNSILNNEIIFVEPYYNLDVVYKGISMHSSNANFFFANNIIKGGFEIRGSFNNDINSSNTVNNRSVIYCENQNGLIIDGNKTEVGQVIIVDCSNIFCSNLNISKVYAGVIISYSYNITVTLSNLSDNGYGIYSEYSEKNTFSDNTFSDNEFDDIRISPKYWYK
ncbi:MAG: right-handed parallel beta-helix repeat-containing protein [Promethearchaeota archaeon]